MFSNPYTQGGWVNPPNQLYVAVPGAQIPSIPDALPCAPSGISADAEKHVSFTFKFQGGGTASILDCIIVGDDLRPRFYISSTHSSLGAITSIKDEGGNLAATVEWQRHPVIQLRTYINNLPRQFSSDFLPLARSGVSRTMTVKNKTYMWSRDPKRECVYLHNVSYAHPEYLGYIIRSSGGNVLLSVVPSVVSEGVLDVAILATILFLSNRSID